MSLQIVQASSRDEFELVWPFFRQIVSAGDTYSYPMDCSYEQGQAFWMPDNGSTFLAKFDNQVVGSFYLKPNQPGLGSHIANAGYMVNPNSFGKGIGKQMGLFSLSTASTLGYKAMQFNYVVSTNTYALKLWESLGFKIIGTSPQSFRLKGTDLVDTHIMHRVL
jgi:ribosomal protein S18 acetylase RimI-like enzyme